MRRNIRFSYVLLLLTSLFLLPTCKSDKKGIESDSKDSKQATKMEIEKHDPVKKTDETSDLKALDPKDSKPDSTSTNTPITEEEKKEKPLPKKEVKKPSKQKPKTTPKKKKPTKIYSNKKPIIQFEELVWNFGEITEGDIVEKKFKFTNTGNAPLQIIATSATCGCTRPSFPFLDIAPGESNVIGVTYNSVGKDGKQNPEVTIESNTIPKITIIKLHGTVVPKPKEEEKQDSLISTKDTISAKQ